MISHDIMQAAIAHACAEYPKEAVGYATDSGYVPLINVAEDPLLTFAINCNQTAEVYANAKCLIHSHTDGSDHPSDLDMQEQADMGLPWCILVVAEAEGQKYLKSSFWFGDQVAIPSYIGREFRHGVTDCYALVRDWYRQEQGVTLPVFPRVSQWWLGPDDLISQNFAEAGFVEIEAKDVEHGDVVALSIGGSKINHLGVYLGNGEFLHHLRGRVSRREPLVRWANHHAGKFLRYMGA